jgi:hypothetical protein
VENVWEGRDFSRVEHKEHKDFEMGGVGERLVKHSLTISTIGLKFAAGVAPHFIKSGCGGVLREDYQFRGCSGKVITNFELG